MERASSRGKLDRAGVKADRSIIMGSLTQYLVYINSDEAPTVDEAAVKYTHIYIDDRKKKERREYRRRTEKQTGAL